eukprot:354746-Chlamydomonas_euryale.AAC.4
MCPPRHPTPCRRPLRQTHTRAHQRRLTPWPPPAPTPPRAPAQPWVGCDVQSPGGCPRLQRPAACPPACAARRSPAVGPGPAHLHKYGQSSSVRVQAYVRRLSAL